MDMPSDRQKAKSCEPAYNPRLDQNSSTLATCDQVITPACIRALYNISLQDLHAQASPNNAMGIFLPSSFYAQEDLHSFYKNSMPYIANGAKPILSFINGGVAPVDILHAGSEADLDLELAIPIIYPQKTVVYQVDDLYWSQQKILESEMYNTFLVAIDGSYCTYEAYGERGNDPDLDPTYPNPRPVGTEAS